METPSVPGGRYGLGLFLLDTSCGIRAYGHDGDAMAYDTWSFHAADGGRQVTVAMTPDFTGDVDEAVDAYLDQALCG
jgi:D-alanyl-D-alanine carboxypeptidase